MNFTTPASKSELLSDLEQIDAYYKPQIEDVSIPTFTVASFTKRTYSPPDDSTLVSKASVVAENETNVMKLEYIIPYQAKMASNRAEKTALEGKKTARMNALDKARDEELASVDAELGKRGMSSSTIVNGVKEKITERYARQKAVEGASFDVQIGKYDAEYGELSNVISDADTLFLKKKQLLFDKLVKEYKEERQKKTDETNEYNNTVNEREIAVNNKWKEVTARLKLSVLNSITSGYTSEKLEALGFYEDKIAVIQAYYSTMSATSAYLDFSQTTEFIRHLGPHYYTTLYQMYRMSKL